MAKKGRHRKGGRTTPKGTQPQSSRPKHREGGGERRERELDLMGNVRRALRDDHPLGLLALVSSLLTVVDPRQAGPMERSRSDADDRLSRDELVRSFLEIDRPETSVLLSVIGTMSADELERARIWRELETRRDDLPGWVVGLGLTTAYRATEMVHVLGDGDNVIVGARFPTGEALSTVVYIDHNMGTLVKDAFVVPEPIDELVAIMRSKTDDPDTAWNDINPADARVRVDEAIALGAMTFPPFETETWPVCRPIVEWINGLLPARGTGYERPEWDDDARLDLTQRFFASPFADGLEHTDYRDLFDSVLWFACDYGPGDPLRWSPVAVEIILADWIPRKIVADAALLSLAPRVLRAFVRFCHDERGVRAELTDETVAAIDEWEPEYQRITRAPRARGPDAILAAIGAFDPDEPGLRFDEDLETLNEIMLEVLGRAVGGAKALADLTDRPLPDEPFAWDGVADDIQPRVAEVLALCDRCCDDLLDTEYRTTCRRLLTRVAAGDPAVFRRKSRPEGTAAAVCWIVGKANELFRPWGGGLLIKELMAHFGIRQGGVSQRAGTLLKAGRFETHVYGDVSLGSPDFLVSSYRRELIEHRERYHPESG
jgi:Domain of unknown function (DUF6398)